MPHASAMIGTARITITTTLFLRRMSSWGSSSFSGDWSFARALDRNTASGLEDRAAHAIEARRREVGVVQHVGGDLAVGFHTLVEAVSARSGPEQRTRTIGEHRREREIEARREPGLELQPRAHALPREGEAHAMFS